MYIGNKFTKFMIFMKTATIHDHLLNASSSCRIVSDRDQLGIGMVENPLFEEEYKMTETELSGSLPASNDYDVAPEKPGRAMNDYDVAPEKPKGSMNAVYFDFGESK